MKALFTKTDDVRDIITELQDITAEEERLAITETVVGMYAFSSDREHLYRLAYNLYLC